MPLTAQDALVSQGSGDDTATADAPLARSRRRRGRGGRGATPENAPETAAAIDIAPASDESQAWARLAEAPDFAEAAAEAETGEAAEEITEGSTEEVGAATAGRRRRRRGRGGRTTSQEAATAPDEDMESASTPDTAVSPLSIASRAPAGGALTPAVLRRFDHRDWREQPGRATARPAMPIPQVAAQAALPPQAETPAPRQADVAALRPVEAPATRPDPVPFERSERAERSDRGRRFPERQPAAGAGEAMPSSTLSPVTGAPPSSTPAPARTTPSTTDVTPAGNLDERLERMLAGQSTLLQQQQQALQSISVTMAALQGAIERMSSHGIAAGMPRAGMFVDAPNVVYAAENARVNIDYGRMLDFLGRGREMVHAIVYAPVTEETGYRMENQRFVAPFLNKGYKLVTKPLKRFPDGTAKGNFDIELAIDIVTMSQRLDVVILISGDSDFSRLIELIQSRGVRVEVVAFASNVSWELVQMADVFIDIGQYVDQFRAV